MRNTMHWSECRVWHLWRFCRGSSSRFRRHAWLSSLIKESRRLTRSIFPDAKLSDSYQHRTMGIDEYLHVVTSGNEDAITSSREKKPRRPRAHQCQAKCIVLRVLR
jgi:hypothetical protein